MNAIKLSNMRYLVAYHDQFNNVHVYITVHILITPESTCLIMHNEVWMAEQLLIIKYTYTTVRAISRQFKYDMYLASYL